MQLSPVFCFPFTVNIMLNPLTAKWALRALIDLTLSNARRFYSTMGNPLDGKGLTSLLSTKTLCATSHSIAAIQNLPNISSCMQRVLSSNPVMTVGCMKYPYKKKSSQNRNGTSVRKIRCTVHYRFKAVEFKKLNHCLCLLVFIGSLSKDNINNSANISSENWTSHFCNHFSIIQSHYICKN